MRVRYGFGHPPEPMSGSGTTVILLSGGIDSATSLALAREQDSKVSTLFIDYGQAASLPESRSSEAIARHYGADHRRLRFAGLSFASGEIRSRNAFLLHAALLALESKTAVITIGIHAGTPYIDSTPEFIDLMRGSFDFHTQGAVALAAPFVDRSKTDVFALAQALGVPIELTYSCEAADSPCGQCLSCLDREALIAGP